MANYIYVVLHFLSAFIVYANKKSDLDRQDILLLSNLLCRNGVDCTVDHYHSSSTVVDWDKWVTHQMDFCISQNGYVLLECSESMYSSLEVADQNPRIQMAAAHVYSLTLLQYIRKSTDRFIPFYIDDPLSELTPKLLLSKSIYHFPFSQLTQDLLGREQMSLLDYETFFSPEFDSLRSLVAILTGQAETPKPKVGKPCKQRFVLCIAIHMYVGIPNKS